MKPFTPPPPVTAADCTPEWVEARREIIARCRFPVQAGAGNTIEVRSLTEPEHLAAHDRLKMNPWVPLMLPNGAVAFATTADRDAVLKQLQP